MRLLKWISVATGEEAVHVAFHDKPAHWSFTAHGHDFCEIMLVERGFLTHHANGVQTVMRKGDAALIRPDDIHAAKAGEDGVRFWNVAFPAEALAHVASRYFDGSTDFWGGNAKIPAHIHLGRDAMERLLYAAKALTGQRRTLFASERFLMNAIQELSPWLGDGSRTDNAQNIPDWLAATHEAMLKPANLKLGVKRLFKLAGRCREHVSRSFKAAYGVGPVDFVNGRRMLLAESMLLTGDAKIPEVAEACGITNLSHFHKLFRERHGISPQRFRVERRSAAI